MMNGTVAGGKVLLIKQMLTQRSKIRSFFPLRFKGTDGELAKLIGRSVKAIQVNFKIFSF